MRLSLDLKLTRRQRLYLAIIAALLLVHLLRALMGGGDARARDAGSAYTSEDFRLRANLPERGSARRDLFAASHTPVKASQPRRAAVRTRAAPAIAAAPAVAPSSSPAELAAARLGRLRLLGVVLRKGQAQAYLAIDGSQPVIAVQGDTAFGEFVVERITVDAVTLRDVTGVATRSIPVSGR